MNSWNLTKSNTSLITRERQREQLLHKQKLREIKPCIDNKPPIQMPHVFLKSKRQLNKNQRNIQISRDNHLLLTKLMKIDHSVPSSSANIQKSTKMLYSQMQQIRKISSQNRLILQRIHSAKPHYSTEKLNKEFSHHQQLTQNISENARRVPVGTSFGSENKIRRPVSARVGN